MSGVLGWGKAISGQLGLKGEEVDKVLNPVQIPNLRGSEVLDIACGENHTLVCLKDGSVYSCGNNDHGQLGHTKSSKRFECVDSLKSQRARKVCAGSAHSVVLTDAYEVFTWGSNDSGQLGRSKVTDEMRQTPKLVKSLAVHSIVQVSCGSRHCIVLTNEGLIATWGANDCGQLGAGNKGGFRDSPEFLSCLNGIPIAQVVAGGCHNFTLSMSGAIYGWGKNSFGQLGLSDQTQRLVPHQCRSLRSQKIKYLSCGEDHTAALTIDGRVFTFGAGSYGQLGHGSTNNEIVPRQVLELSGNEVTQIACGRRHTLAHVTKTGKLYSFGLGGSGQLGIGDASNRTSPSRVQGPFLPDTLSSDNPLPMQVDNEGMAMVVQKIFTGGDHSFLLYKYLEMQGDVADNRVHDPSTQILTLSEHHLAHIERLKSDEIPSTDLSDEITKIFSHASCINGSFLLLNDEHYGSSSKNHGVDLDQVRDAFVRLEKSSNIIIKQKICNSLETLVRRLPHAPPDVEAMRVYLVLGECHLFHQPKNYASLLDPFGQAIIRLDKTAAKFLGQWWAKLQPSYFNHLVMMYKQCIEFLLQLPDTDNDMEVMKRQQALFVALEVLKNLNTVNEDNNQVIPYHKFYVPELKDRINLRKDYLKWLEHTQLQNQSGGFQFCSYPFLFDAAAKSILLQTDATLQMQSAVEAAARQNLMGLLMPIEPTSAMLVLMVSRSNLVKDTINQLEKHKPTDLKKPLKVVFLGEEAVDEGGVRKEFFMLLLRDVMDPKYGMFLYYEESRLQWFNAQSFEGNEMFHLIGTLCGLAIYNFTIIDLHFPLALFKKLLKRPVTLDDLKELMPTVGRSLQDLLDHEGGDEEDVFCLNFVINQEMFGEIKTVALCPDGETKTVTHENKNEYVDLYVDCILNRSVHSQFTAFNDGFHKVCGGHILELFHPQELQALVIGNEDYDFHELEKNAEYKGEYHRYHPTIKLFWEVFYDLSIQNKKKFLLFLTGSDRIPVLGMKYVKIVIQPTGGGENFLPVAHTCFNLLDLPKYASRQSLEEKLLLAIQHTEGFGIV
ncbi:probable E3 ubiquitin-protein ligase HERC4 isoform X2 [Pomacea canaliculata]|uniref:probable E3 ubiquitin-protein ligase HERC4 isoform X2 n=1 Tax=Pomacea canaliculata TaxID=400727 RepID=UPI000D72BC08|nr:probable E3 ubiquitin-protein ligase HERC4 isoform X2 [Pomacea canaliculata]